MNMETESVINFFKENPSFEEDYLNIIEDGELETISYSGLLLKLQLSGTTKDHVNFSSYKVSRGEVTKYLKGVSNERLNKREQ